MIMEPLEYLKILEENGYSSYIVGGYVRDKLMGIDSFDVDITTSALPKEVAKIFKSATEDNLGSISIKSNNYTIDITTFRKEGEYSERHPKKVDYVTDIHEDLKRRDFTINAICMDMSGHIFDPLMGVEDLNRKLIRVIGDVAKKFSEDPLRMLRAIRFSVLYDFEIEESAYNYILEHKELLSTLSNYRRKQELNKILLSTKAKVGLQKLKEMGILSILEIEVPESYVEVKDLMGSWAQLKFSDYQFSKNEMTRLKNIRKIVEDGRITSDTIIAFGIYDCLVAGEILGIGNTSVLALYNAMPIHNVDEIVLNGDDIKRILGCKSGPIIKDIKKDLLRMILSGNLHNSESDLTNYICKNWK